MKQKKINNYTKEHILYLKKQKHKKIIVLALQISILILLFSLWELLADLNIIDSFFVSSPSRMFVCLVDVFKNNNFSYHIWVTFYEAILAFFIATGVGFFIAILLYLSDTLRKVLDPYLVILNSLPKIALGPLIIIWFRVGTKSIVIMAILILIIVTILSCLTALLSCDKDKILLMRSLGANKLQILTKLVIPNAFPEFISILKINVGLTCEFPAQCLYTYSLK
jgi:NitT/TauT family transport system permease protein